jgi:hypothetical protein
MDNTLPLYSFFIKSSGAMYAGEFPQWTLVVSAKEQTVKKNREHDSNQVNCTAFKTSIFLDSQQTTMVYIQNITAIANQAPYQYK